MKFLYSLVGILFLSSTTYAADLAPVLVSMEVRDEFRPHITIEATFSNQIPDTGIRIQRKLDSETEFRVIYSDDPGGPFVMEVLAIPFGAEYFMVDESLNDTVLGATYKVSSVIDGQLGPALTIRYQRHLATLNGIALSSVDFLPIPGAKVSLYSSFEGGPYHLLETTYTNQDGSFEFPPQLNGDFRVTASHTEFGNIEFIDTEILELGTNQSTEVTLTLDPNPTPSYYFCAPNESFPSSSFTCYTSLGTRIVSNCEYRGAAVLKYYACEAHFRCESIHNLFLSETPDPPLPHQYTDGFNYVCR